MFDTTPTRVERAIRCAIENAWDRCNVDTFKQMFGCSFDENKRRPSNSDFIAMIAYQVLSEKKLEN